MLERLASEFDLGPVGECPTLRIGSSNALFRLASPRGSVVLRRLTRTPERVARQHDLLRYLARHGFPAMPAIESPAGTTLLTEGDATYALYPFVQGDHPKPGDPDAARLAGRALARLHALTARSACVPPNPRPPMRDRFLSSAARFGARVDAVLANPSLRGAHADARWLGGRVQALAGELSDPVYGGLPSALIHGDFNRENLILRDGSFAAVLDFDLATEDARAADLAVALHYLPRRNKGGPLAVPVAATLLHAYEEVSPLDARERQALALLIEAKAARSAMRMLRHIVKAPPRRRTALGARLGSQLQSLRALDQDRGWRAALASPAVGH